MTLAEAIAVVEHIRQACHSHRVFRGNTLPVIVMRAEDEEALRLVLDAAEAFQAEQDRLAELLTPKMCCVVSNIQGVQSHI